MAGTGTPQKLDLNAVWSRGMHLVRENLQLLGVLAGVFVLLPSAFVSFAMPPQQVITEPLEVLMEPTTSEEAKRLAMEAVGKAMAPFMVWSVMVQIVQHAGYAAMMALVGRNRPTVGGAIAQGLKAVLPVMVALLIYFIAIYALMIVLPLILSPFGAAVAAFFGAIVGVLALLFVTARLSLTMPVIVIENQMNPFRALRQSWKLTGQSSGNVFGFWMLLIVAYFVIFILISAVAGLLAAIAGEGAGATLIGGLIGGIYAAVTGIVICAVAVAMHAQLSGPSPSSIASEFE